MKTDNNYPYLTLNKDNFEFNVNLPKRLYPPVFTKGNKNEDNFMGGYFVSYNIKVTFNDVIRNLLNHNWHFFSQIIGDFFLIYCNFKSHELFILTDQTGKFPCYFSIEDGILTLSTHFKVVRDSLKVKKLDLETSLDLISFNYIGSVTDSTILKGIKQIPPGCLLHINNSKFDHTLTSLVRLNDFFKIKVKYYSTLEKFADDFLLELEQIINERLEKVHNLGIAADISSGFDCTIICYLLKKLLDNNFKTYSIISQFANEDTVPEVLASFVKKHDLKLGIVKGDNYYPFASDFYLSWIKNYFYPADHALELNYVFECTEIQDGYPISFQGSGGDEVYSSYALGQTLPFSIQDEYFHTISSFKYYQLGELFTKKGQEMFLEQKRFQKRTYYPLLLSPTTVLVNTLYFPVHWKSGIWQMTPYNDPRLVQLARGIPRKNENAPSKLDIWSHRKDIFVDSQFRPKGLATLANRFLTEKKDFIIQILKNSLLAEKGVVDAERIIKDFSSGDIKKYQDSESGLSVYLLNLLNLEYFIQQNNVKVGDI